MANLLELLFLLASSSASFVPCTASFQPWNLATFPNPTTSPEKCGRNVDQSWVCDPDGVMGESSANVVEGIIKTIVEGWKPMAKHSCGGDMVGYEVAVAVMNSFVVGTHQRAEEVAETFAKGLHDAWGVGHSACNDGVLLLVSIQDRQIYISTGAGAMKVLSHKACGKIIDGMKPFMRAGRYGEALENAVKDIGLTLAAGRTVKWYDMFFDEDNFAGIMLTAFVGFAGVSMWFNRRQQRSYDGCMEKLKKLKRDQEQYRASGTFNASTCPICFEDFQWEDRTGTADSPDDPDKGDASEEKPMLAAEPPEPQTAHGKDMKPLVLPCGHAFCAPCITEWIKQKKTNCPICRKNIDDGEPEPFHPSGPCTADNNMPRTGTRTANADGFGSATQTETPQGEDTFAQGPSTSTGNGAANRGASSFFRPGREEMRRRLHQRRRDMLHAELLFRLMSLRRQYPSYITEDMYRGWEQDINGGNPMSQTHMTAFENLNPRVRAQMESRGSSGSSHRFGGGSSRGGGGRGGSW